MKKKLLIIGGTGFFGYHLSNFFKKKYEVVSLSKYRPLKKRKLKNIKYVYGDISKKKQILFLKKINFEYIINCGGYVDHINKNLTYNNHYIGCKNLVEIFKDKNLKLFIQVGSSAEYGNIKSPQYEKVLGKAKSIYGRSKLKATKYLFKTKNFPFVVLRFYQLYGPKQDVNRFIPFVIKSCLAGKKFPCSDCTQFRDFLYIEDAVKAVSKCLINKNKINNKIINIGCGEIVQLKTVINFIKSKIKKGIPDYGKIKLRSDEIKKLYPSLNNAKYILNWKSQINFKKGINKTISYFKKYELH